MYDWKAARAAHDRAVALANAPSQDGQEPIGVYWSEGDGMFALRYNDQLFTMMFNIASVNSLAEQLATSWRQQNAPELVGLPIPLVYRSGDHSPRFSTHIGQTSFLSSDELAAKEFVRRTLHSRIMPTTRS